MKPNRKDSDEEYYTEDELAECMAACAHLLESMPKLLNPGLILCDDTFAVKAPLDPVEETLQGVGLMRIGSEKVDFPQFTPHGCRFECLGEGRFMMEGQVVTRFSLPPLGAEIVSKGHFTSYQVNVAGRTLGLGQDITQRSIGGVRPKIDGESVVLFVVHLADGSCRGILYDKNEVRVCDATEPALYERVGDVYWLLSGPTKSPIPARVSLWRDPTRENVEDCSNESGEGVIINMNGLDYKAKTYRDATLYSRGGRVVDSVGFSYSSPSPGPEGLNDYLVSKDNVATFVRERPDRRVGDTHNKVVKLLSSPLLSDVLCKFPAGRTDSRFYSMPYYYGGQSDVDYRLEIFNQPRIGPTRWSKRDSDLKTTQSLLTWLAQDIGMITPGIIADGASHYGYFVNGDFLGRLSPVRVNVEMDVGVFKVSDSPPPPGWPFYSVISTVRRLQGRFKIFSGGRVRCYDASGLVVLYLYRDYTLDSVCKVLGVEKSVVEMVERSIVIARQGSARPFLVLSRDDSRHLKVRVFPPVVPTQVMTPKEYSRYELVYRLLMSHKSLIERVGCEEVDGIVF